MPAHSLVRVGLKLLGLYLYISAAMTFLQLFTMMPVYSGSAPHELAWSFIVTELVSVVALAVFATLLVRHTGWFEKRIFTLEDSDPSGFSLDERSITVTAFSVVGLIFVILGLREIPALVFRWLRLLPAVSNGSPGDFMVFQGKELVTALAEIAIGLALFVGQRTVYGLWKRAVSLFPAKDVRED